MTTDEIVLFATGIGVGAQLMTFLHMVWDMRDARRNEKISRAAWRDAAGDRYLSSLRLYQLQQRSRA
ncbi:hypothetical protein [Streptomyces pseudovenezuelae]|uniref:hypothetical protein n=1 Tax=Streptomyces pseudovenezuelae TaxID=67350 RepID=UPI002E328321|nr:hypothetical protein [Streptomyces pseudovenezuelae]